MRVSVPDLDAGPIVEPPRSVQARLTLLREKLSPDMKPQAASRATVTSMPHTTSILPTARSLVTPSQAIIQSDPRAAELRDLLAKDAERLSADVDARLAELTLRRRARLSVLVDKVEAEEWERECQRRELEAIERERELKREAERLRREQEAAAERARIEAEARARKEAHQRAVSEAEERARREASERIKYEEAERAREKAESDKKRAETEARNAERKKQEEEREAAARESEKQQLEAAAKARAEASDTDFQAVEAAFDRNVERISWIKTNVKEAVTKDPQTKQAAFQLKLRLKPKFGQLTNSKRQLMRIRTEIDALFKEVQAGSPLVFQYALNMYAKFVVQQAESEANVAVQAALPLAMVTVLLWADYPDLGDFVIPRFIKKCPQVIGYSCETKTEVGLKRMAYRQRDGRWESPEQYAERIAGICSVWSTITQAKLGASQGKKHPYPIVHSWVFLARQLNRPLEEVALSDVAAVAAWWDMTAKRFVEAFGKQAEKLLDLAWNTWTSALAERRYPAAARLRILGEEWRRTGELNVAWRTLEA